MRMRGGRARGWVASGMGGVLALAMLGGPAPALATSPPSIGADVGGCYASIAPVAPSTSYTATITRGSPATVVKSFSGTSTDFGYAIFSWSCKQAVLRAGDRVHVVVDTIDQEWIVPSISLQADPVADVLSGTVPTETTVLSVTLLHCFLGINQCFGLVGDQHPTVGLDGSWSSPTGSFDLTGGDSVQVIANIGGDAWTRSLRLPSFSARPGTAGVYGLAPAGKRVRVTLLGRNGVVRAAAVTRTGLDGRWKTTLKHRGKPVRVRPGDRVRTNVTGSSTLRVFDAGLAVKASTGKGSATCRPGAHWLVIAYKGGKDVDGADGVADATTGRITFSFASQKPLTGWSFTLRCLDANGLQLMDAARAK